MGIETERSAADLSREELYALVWQRPLSRLGPELGIDGSRLAKLCDLRNVPYPRAGYWSKAAVGRAPPRTPLPAEPPLPRNPAITPVPIKMPATRPRTATPAKDPPKRELSPDVQEYLAIEADFEDGLDELTALHPKIYAWIAQHEKEQSERICEYRRRPSNPWARTDNLLGDLTPRDIYRFRATSTLCHSMEKAGITVKDALFAGKLIFAFQGRDIECSIMEKMSRAPKGTFEDPFAWTAYPHHHNSGLTSSGWLRVQITTRLPGEQPQWIESTKTRFVDLIPMIVYALNDGVPRLIEWERQREEARRKGEEEQARRWELQRLREIDDRQWGQFIAAVANWKEMRVLDEFITALEARLSSEDDEAIAGRSTADWIAWARKRASELDPMKGGLSGLFETVARR